MSKRVFPKGKKIRVNKPIKNSEDKDNANIFTKRAVSSTGRKDTDTCRKSKD